MGAGIGSAILDRVTIYNNQAQNGGGILYYDQYGAGQDGLELTNVTIYSNTATSSGGGIYVDGSGGGITETNVTIAENKAGTNGGSSLGVDDLEVCLLERERPGRKFVRLSADQVQSMLDD